MPFDRVEGGVQQLPTVAVAADLAAERGEVVDRGEHAGDGGEVGGAGLPLLGAVVGRGPHLLDGGLLQQHASAPQQAHVRAEELV
ncbi:MAG: hypothetical protein ACK5BN_03015, partial [Planctomycetota bacterium]